MQGHRVGGEGASIACLFFLGDVVALVGKVLHHVIGVIGRGIFASPKAIGARRDIGAHAEDAVGVRVGEGVGHLRDVAEALGAVDDDEDLGVVDGDEVMAVVVVVELAVVGVAAFGQHEVITKLRVGAAHPIGAGLKTLLLTDEVDALGSVVARRLCAGEVLLLKLLKLRFCEVVDGAAFAKYAAQVGVARACRGTVAGA